MGSSDKISQIVKADNDGRVSHVNQQVFIGEYEPIEKYYIKPSEVFERVNLKNFKERKWLSKEVDKFLEENDRGYFILEAEAGLGKTTFLAWLVNEKEYIHNFCELTRGIESSGRAILNIVAQLVQKYELSPWEVEGILPTTASRPGFLSNLLFRAAEKRPSGEKVVIVVDALDEAGILENQNVLSLPEVLPAGVFIIVSMRPIGGVKPHIDIASTPRKIFILAAENPNNKDDILEYLRSFAKRSEMASKLKESRIGEESFIQVLLAKSQGVWVYLHYVVSEIEKGQRSLLNLDKLPNGLAQYYADYWNRWEKKDHKLWQDIYLRLLAGLTAAQEAVTLSRLCALVEIEFQPRFETLFDEEWRPFLSVDGDANIKYYRLYHASLRDFFEGHFDRKEFTVEERKISRQIGNAIHQAHGRIASIYNKNSEQWNKDNGYAFKHLHIHLLHTSPEEMFKLLENPDWLEAQRKFDYTLETYHRSIVVALDYLGSSLKPSSLPGIIELSLLSTSVSSLATTYTSGILAALIYLGDSPQVLRYTSLMVDPKKKTDCLLHIINALREKQEHSLVFDAIEQIFISIEAIPDLDGNGTRYDAITTILLDMKYRTGLTRLLNIICNKHDSSSVINLIHQIVKTGLWEDPDNLITMTEKTATTWDRETRLIELAGWFADANNSQLAYRSCEKAAQGLGKKKNNELADMFAKIASILFRIKEPEFAHPALKRAVGYLGKIEPGESRISSCLEISRCVDAEQRTAWLMAAVSDIKNIKPRSWSGKASAFDSIPELLQELTNLNIGVENIDFVSILRSIFTKEEKDVYDQAAAKFWENMGNVAGPLAVLTKGKSNLDLLDLVPDKRAGYITDMFPALAKGIVAFPERDALGKLIDKLESVDNDWAFVAEVIADTSLVTVKLQDQTAMERLFKIGLNYADGRDHYHHLLWSNLAHAFIHFHPKISIKQWLERLGDTQNNDSEYEGYFTDDGSSEKNRITYNKEFNKLIATYSICCTLVTAGQHKKAINLANTYHQNLRYRLWTHETLNDLRSDLMPDFCRNLIENGYLEDGWKLLNKSYQENKWQVDLYNINTGEQNPRYIFILKALAERAATLNQLDILVSVSELALRINNAVLLDITAPLLAQAGKVGLAEDTIQAYRTAATFLKSDYHSQSALIALDQTLGFEILDDKASKLAMQIKLTYQQERNTKSITNAPIFSWLKNLFDQQENKKLPEWMYFLKYGNLINSGSSDRELVICETLLTLARQEAWGPLEATLALIDINHKWQYDEKIYRIEAVANILLLKNKFNLLFMLYHSTSDEYILKQLWLRFCETASEQTVDWLMYFLEHLAAWHDETGQHLGGKERHEDYSWSGRIPSNEKYNVNLSLDLYLAIAVVLSRNNKTVWIRHVLTAMLNILNENNKKSSGYFVSQTYLSDLIAQIEKKHGTAEQTHEKLEESQLINMLNAAVLTMGYLSRPLVAALLIENRKILEDYNTTDKLFDPGENYDYSGYGFLRLIGLTELAARCNQPSQTVKVFEKALRQCEGPITVSENSYTLEAERMKLSQKLEAIYKLSPLLNSLGITNQFWEAVEKELPDTGMPDQISIDQLPSFDSLFHIAQFAIQNQDWEHAEKILLFEVILCTDQDYEKFITVAQEFPPERNNARLSAFRNEIVQRAEMMEAIGGKTIWLYLPGICAMLRKPSLWALEILLKIRDDLITNVENRYYHDSSYGFLASNYLFRIAEQLNTCGYYDDALKTASISIGIMLNFRFNADRQNAWRWLWKVVKKLKATDLTKNALVLAQLASSYPTQRKEELSNGFQAGLFLAQSQPENAMRILNDLFQMARQGGRSDVWDLISTSAIWIKELGGNELVEILKNKIAIIDQLFPPFTEKTIYDKY